MDFTLHSSFPFELKQEWDALLAETPTHVPFLLYDYQEIWWATRGGGEWPDAELCIVTARENGRLVGVAPLFKTPDYQGRPALMLVGSIEISDYLDLIVRPADLPAFLAGLLPFLQREIPGWQALDFYNLLDSSPTLAALEAAAGAGGLTYRLEPYLHCPYIPLPGDWETYLAGIDKKQRHEIRRKMRRAAEAAVPAEWYFVTDGSTLDAEVDDFLELMKTDEDKRRFLTPVMEKQFHLTARCAFEHGCLFLAFMKIGDRKAAGYYCFDYLGKLWVYNSGINWTDFSEYSPGWVLLGHLLQWANENGRTAFDFMRGDEEYKYRFGAIDRFVKRAVVEK